MDTENIKTVFDVSNSKRNAILKKQHELVDEFYDSIDKSRGKKDLERVLATKSEVKRVLCEFLDGPGNMSFGKGMETVFTIERTHPAKAYDCVDGEHQEINVFRWLRDGLVDVIDDDDSLFMLCDFMISFTGFKAFSTDECKSFIRMLGYAARKIGEWMEDDESSSDDDES